MRFAIVSDIHANRQAWNAVFLDIRSLKADRIISLGDVIGYGPSPRETLEAVYADVHHFVLGNHDAALCGKINEDLFHERARQSLAWTRARLGRHAFDFLASWPLSLAGPGFRCAHGDFANPALFNYVVDPADALPSWNAVPEPLLFVGHTHTPGLYLIGASNTPYRLEPQDFCLEEGKRYLVNVGSVGSPRDGGARASYCLYDAEERAVYWRQIPFDLDAYREAAERAGASLDSSYFLNADPRRGAPPLRKMLGFNPPTAAENGAKDVVAVQDLRVLQGRLRAWRQRFVVAVGLLVLCCAVAAALWTRHTTRAMTIGETSPAPITADAVQPGTNLLPPLTTTDATEELGAGWYIAIGNRYRQHWNPVRVDGVSPGLLLRSETPEADIRLVGPIIQPGPWRRFTAEGFFRKSADFEGTVALVVSVTRVSGAATNRIEQHVVKEPAQVRREGWQSARQTFDLPAGTLDLQLSVRGRFKGVVEVRDLLLAAVAPDRSAR